MKAPLYLWSTLLCLIFVLPSSGAAEMQPDIAVQAKILPALAHGPILEISMTNVGDQAISLFKANLPWSTRHALLLVPVTADQKAKRLDEALYIDDPGPGVVTLSPSQVLSGRIDLGRRFPGLRDALQRSDVILFWSYETELSNDAKTNRVNGAVVIARTPK
jgi:hypothetical protein